MKKLLGVVLAIAALVSVFAFGNEMSGPVGGLAAVGLSTYAVSYFAPAYWGNLALTSVGVLRPLPRGKSNLAGIRKAVVFREDQFLEDAIWPKRGKGKITGEIPLKVGEKGRVWTFDKGSARGYSSKSGKVTNQSTLHNFDGRVSGYEQESIDTFDDVYNVGLIIVGFHYNGTRVVYGSTLAPIMLTENTDTQTLPESEGGIGVAFTGVSEVGCDFHPRILDAAVVLPTEEPVPYPTDPAPAPEPDPEG